MKLGFRTILLFCGCFLGACSTSGLSEIAKTAQDDPVVAAALVRMTSRGLRSQGPPEVVTLTKLSSGMGSRATYLVAFRFHVAHNPRISDSPEGQIVVVARVRYGLVPLERGKPGPRVDLLDDGTVQP